ncbi:CPBP family intramembrane metalloprotease [Petralouisia muris]|uniref:CPBP family intramembrane metalloprotease n=1 Tax=Petralouisia muris TaxID=3032872 RepID=A0AC61RRB1_9FIRM|nr:CPBP family intramembrane metalloprotease [Petralouisia muris]
MVSSKNLNRIERKSILLFLFYSFLIAWGTEVVLILLYHFQLIRGSAAQILHFAVIGFGAGMAPAYAAFIIERKYSRATVKGFIKKVFQTENWGKSIAVLILFALVQFLACILQEEYSGNPWYMFILFMPMMILGGGLEEIGWQGVFQPLLQKRFSFLIAALIEGVIWSIWVSVLLHAWSNAVLGGMYTLTSLCGFPSLKTWIVSLTQIIVIMLVLLVFFGKDLSSRVYSGLFGVWNVWALQSKMNV